MQASMCHQRDERVQKCPAQRPLWHTGHAHQATHQNRNLTCALTSTCFLQHSQTGAASLKHIVKQLNTCAGVTIQVPSNRSKYATKCAGLCANPDQRAGPCKKIGPCSHLPTLHHRCALAKPFIYLPQGYSDNVIARKNDYAPFYVPR